MCQKYEENELGNLKILYEVPYKKNKKNPNGLLPVFSEILWNTKVRFLCIIFVVSIVTDLSPFAWDFPGFKTESLTSQETPQYWANWNG